MRTLLLNLHTSAFHCSELDESEIDLNECEHVFKENLDVNWDRDILLSEFWVFLDGGR